MKRIQFLKGLFSALLIAGITSGASAQTKENIFDGSTEITWLGLDFTQAKYIGSAMQFKDAGEITNAQFRDKYAPGWNQLFLNEPKKFEVAAAVHRSEVKYALDVTEKANNGIKKDFFTEDGNEYKKLDEAKIESLVKKYDYQGKTGIGMLFFVDGMSKGKEEAGAWVTFVDMKSKKMLLTTYITGKSGGFGFRNYWAKAFNEILKEFKSQYKKLKG